MQDPILFWNRISLDAVAADHTGDPPKGEHGGPTRTARALAIVHLAMYDAFTKIDGSYAPYLGALPAPPAGASRSAAVSEAARMTLASLYKNQSAAFDGAMADYVPTLTDSVDSIEKGLLYGRAVALAMLKNRDKDGSDDNTPYTPLYTPGRHRPDPFHPGQGFLSPNWGGVETFGIGDVSAFRAAAPPALNSNDYKNDYNDVKQKGVKSGGARTPEETVIGLYWGYDGAQKLGTPPRLYNQIARVIAASQSNTTAKNARLFALINMAMADAGIQCWESKYFHNIWRPVIGIREGDSGYGPQGSGDGNSGTKGDPFWEPYGAPATNPIKPGTTNFTPNFPAYPSGHATFGAALFETIKLFYNGDDDIAFTFVSDELNGKSVDTDGSVRTLHKRRFSKLSDAMKENARSRVYLGVHWQFDADAGVKAGKEIAKEIFDNKLLPV
jgi:hypothetical protein